MPTPPLVFERSFSFSPGPTNDTGPYRDYACWCHVGVVATTTVRGSRDDIPDANQALLREVQEMLDTAENFLETRLKAEGYRFQKNSGRARLDANGPRSEWNPLASAETEYEFFAPTERWKEQRGDEEVEVRGVRDPFPNVPLDFLRGLRLPLMRALDARFEGQWDFGHWKVRMASRIADRLTS